jgi:ribonuclease HII
VDKKKIKDSKKLSKNKRNLLEKYIKKNSIWTIGSASLKEIEKLNILNASLLAMERSIKKLKSKPSLIMIDGNKLPIMNGYKLKSIVKGDQKVPEISAASIIAKVSRDRLISKMSKKFVKYGWNKNSGYGTKQHLKAIKKFGVTKHHRKTFVPIHNILSLKKIS